MRLPLPFRCGRWLVLLTVLVVTASAAPRELTFAGTRYLERWEKDNLHEFTPPGQEDLQKWSDMVSLVSYPDAKDGEGLAQVANAVLSLYQRSGGKVLRTNSVPRTPERPAEHFVCIVLGTPELIEIVFARLLIHQGRGLGVVYSHRIYGQKVGPAASAWLKEHGVDTEKQLMALQEFPDLAPKPAVKP